MRSASSSTSNCRRTCVPGDGHAARGTSSVPSTTHRLADCRPRRPRWRPRACTSRSGNRRRCSSPPRARTRRPAPAAGARAAGPRAGAVRHRAGGRGRRHAQGDHPGRDLQPEPAQRNADSTPEAAPHPEVFDPEATLPALRSGGLRSTPTAAALRLLDAIQQSKAFNDALEAGGAQRGRSSPRTSCAATGSTSGNRAPTNGTRCTGAAGKYRSAKTSCLRPPTDEEGFVQLAATQPAPGARASRQDLYVHEVIARWAGWSLSVPLPGQAAEPLRRSRQGDSAGRRRPGLPHGRAADAVQGARDLQGRAGHRCRALRFGSRYRMRARAVDLAGNSLRVDDPLADALALSWRCRAIRRASPTCATSRCRAARRDPRRAGRDRPGLGRRSTGDPDLQRRRRATTARRPISAAATATSSRRAPASRWASGMGMFDGADGKLKADAATWKLIGGARRRPARTRPRFDDRRASDGQDVPDRAGRQRSTRCPICPICCRAAPRFATCRDRRRGHRPRGARRSGRRRSRRLRAARRHQPAAGLGHARRLRRDATTGSRRTASAWRWPSRLPAQTDAAPHWDPGERVLTVFLPKGQHRRRAAQQLHDARRPEADGHSGSGCASSSISSPIFGAAARAPAARPARGPASPTSCSARSRAGTGC